jgi:hypothetical protein
MAKRRKTKKAGSHRRKKRVGAMDGIMEAVMCVGATVVGGLGAAFAIQAGNTAFGAQLASAQWVVPAGTAGLGAGVMYLGHKEKQPALTCLGAGVAAVGGVLAVNQMGLSVPGISGLAMSNNAPFGTSALSKAVGRHGMGCAKVNGPNAFLNKTVSGRSSRLMRMGSLISD